MNDGFKVFLSLSVSGSLIILILFLGRRFWRDKVSRQWQYYLWLIAIARLLIPYAPETNLIGNMFQTVGRTAFHAETVLQEQEQQPLPIGLTGFMIFSQEALPLTA